MDDLMARINARRTELAQGGNGLLDRIAKRREELGGKVTHRTDDGGEVRQLSDGSLTFKSPAYSTNDPEIIARIMEGASPASESVSSFDRQTIAQHPIAARIQEFNQGAPIVGEWMDEAVGVVAPKAADAMRATSNAMERENPAQSTALNVAGGIAYTAPLALAGAGAKAADWIGKAGSTLGRIGRVAAVSGGAGAVEGGAAFSGRDNEDRARGLGVGVGVGGAFGAFLGPFADAFGIGTSALARRIKGLDVSTIVDHFGVSAPAARTIKEALMNDDLGAAAARLGQLGDDAMLADAGPATQALIDAASKTGGKALAVTRDAVEGRAAEFGQRLPSKLDAILGGVKGIKTAAREISQSTASARKSAYDRAYSTAINYADDVGRKIEDVLGHIPADAMRSAIKEANEEMQSLGIKNMQILADIADDGTVTFREMPNVRQLDELKKALGRVGAKAVDTFGRKTSEGLRYDRLAGELRDAISDAVPTYRTALKLGGDKLQRDAALDMGRSLLRSNTTVEDVKDFIRVNKGLSTEAREAVAQGLRENIEQTLGSVKRTITDPNVDAREAMTLVKELSSRNNIAKVRMVLGKDKADALLSELDKQATALLLRGAVARNSDTAIRGAIQGQVKAEVQPGMIRRTIGNAGNPLEAGREITQTIAGIDPRSMSQAERAVFAEIAQALTSIRGSDAQRALVAVKNAMNGQPIKDAEAQLIGRIVATSALQPAYQSAKQALTSR